jgi:hypothetical protein
MISIGITPMKTTMPRAYTAGARVPLVTGALIRVYPTGGP